METSRDTTILLLERLSPDEVQHLHRLLNKLDSSKVASCLVPSMCSQVLLLMLSLILGWLILVRIDTWQALLKVFKTTLLVSKGTCVKIANGSLTPACGTNSISSILRVPGLELAKKLFI